jgi:enoyl-CoA hydratase/carnithine racemase
MTSEGGPNVGRSDGKALPWHVDTPPIRRWIERMEEDGKGDEAWHRVELWEQMVAEHGVVKTRTEGRVGVVELSYPRKGNAIVPPMYRMFVEAMERLGSDEDVWVIVITGSGRNFSTGGYVGHDAFYAGLDAGSMGSKAEPMRRTFVEMFQLVPLAVYNCEKPTIAMVNGLVMAESIDIALSADLRTGSPDTTFRFSFAATGNTAYTGAAWSLPRLVGLARAKQFLLTADAVDGRRAYEAGLLTELFEEELESRTMELAQRIAGLPPITLRLIKKEIHRGLALGEYATALDLYSTIEPIVQFTEDHMDAENAVIEKRPPVVRGR